MHCILCATTHDSNLEHLMTTYYTKEWLYCQRYTIIKLRSWVATLRVAVSFQVIMYVNIKIVKRCYYDSLQVCYHTAKSYI